MTFKRQGYSFLGLAGYSFTYTKLEGPQAGPAPLVTLDSDRRHHDRWVRTGPRWLGWVMVSPERQEPPDAHGAWSED